MNELKLKPCPFCGGEAHTRTNTVFDKNFKWTVECELEGCMAFSGCSFYRTEAEAVDAWNTRAKRTCTVTRDFNCSNCGKQIGVVRNCEMYETCDGRQAWKSLDHEVCDVPNYCKNCGAKVIK